MKTLIIVLAVLSTACAYRGGSGSSYYDNQRVVNAINEQTQAQRNNAFFNSMQDSINNNRARYQPDVIRYHNY